MDNKSPDIFLRLGEVSVFVQARVVDKQIEEVPDTITGSDGLVASSLSFVYLLKIVIFVKESFSKYYIVVNEKTPDSGCWSGVILPIAQLCYFYRYHPYITDVSVVTHHY